MLCWELRTTVKSLGLINGVVWGFFGVNIFVHLVRLLNRSVHLRCVQEHETLLARWQNKNTESVIELHNKTPVWNDDTQSYVLNFHGRVTQASVKNFQIIHDNDRKYHSLSVMRSNSTAYPTWEWFCPCCYLSEFILVAWVQLTAPLPRSWDRGQRVQKRKNMEYFLSWQNRDVTTSRSQSYFFFPPYPYLSTCL